MASFRINGVCHLILRWNELNAQLRRNVTIDDARGVGPLFPVEPVRRVTCEVHHVDAGYAVVGFKQEDAPEIALVLPIADP